MIEPYARTEAGGISGRVHLQPDPVQVEGGIAAPAESFKWAATRILGEDAARPGAVREPLAKVADFDAVEPDRMLAVKGGHRIIELDHLLHAHPLAGLGLHSRRIEQEIAPIVAVGRLPHVHNRKSTRLNSSHSQISYAVFCLKKKKKICN